VVEHHFAVWVGREKLHATVTELVWRCKSLTVGNTAHITDLCSRRIKTAHNLLTILLVDTIKISRNRLFLVSAIRFYSEVLVRRLNLISSLGLRLSIGYLMHDSPMV
jgi:hypothetical protein